MRNLKHKISDFIYRNDLCFFHIPLVVMIAICFSMAAFPVDLVFLLWQSAIYSIAISFTLVSLSTWARTVEKNKLFNNSCVKDKQ